MGRTVSKHMEDKKNAGWFHCGRCGAFFGAEVGSGMPEHCPECGRHPSVDPSEIAFVQASGGTRSKSSARQSEGSSSEGSRSRGGSRRKKESNGLVVFVAVWLAILVILAGAVKFFQGSDEGGDELGFGIASDEQQIIAGELNECKRKVVEFLDAGAPESRVEYVINPVDALKRMSGWQQEITLSASVDRFDCSIANVIETPKGKAIETVWAGNGNRQVEAVFFEDDEGEWKIDWANMARYSELDWSLFLLGSDEEEGEFRLLARRRSEVSPGEGKIASVVLIGPRAGSPGELGASSPEVVVDPNSRIGRVLSEAFAKRDAGEGIYSSQASQLDPKGMIRLRAKVVREGGAERSFAIREILACHWYDFDDLGLEK
jgi:hypothetical protein